MTVRLVSEAALDVIVKPCDWRTGIGREAVVITGTASVFREELAPVRYLLR